MKVKSILILTAAGIMLAACQSNTYHIKGTVKDVPRENILVKDGQFELSGETDSTYFCMIYSKNEEALNIPLFIEPGTTKVLLSKTPGEGRVGGTPINDEFQRMTDSTMVIGKEINNIAEKVFANEKATQEEQQQAWAQIEKLNQRHAKVVLDFTERNIKNELGYFLLTMYPEEVIPNTDRLRLIKMMPAELRQRDAIKTIEQQIGNASKTEEGAVIENFTMPSIEGVPMSIMSEVGKNKITVLDFWASWCGPCRQETPLMVEIYKKYKDKGLGLVGISLDEDGDAWKQATDQLGIVWPQMSDLKGWENAAAQMFNITSIPHTIVVDQQGKILRRGLRGEQLEQFIAGQLQ